MAFLVEQVFRTDKAKNGALAKAKARLFNAIWAKKRPPQKSDLDLPSYLYTQVTGFQWAMFSWPLSSPLQFGSSYHWIFI